MRPHHRRRRIPALVAPLTAVALLGACSGSGTGPERPADRVLSLSINPRSVPPPASQDVADAVDTALAAGVRGVALTFTWSSLEPAPRTYDLDTTSWDSPAMQARFRTLLDTVKSVLSSRVVYLSIGNEVDPYLSAHNEWVVYDVFYDSAVVYAHRVLPGVRVGVTTTFAGASGADRAWVQDLNSASDVVIFTYYPLHGDFQVNAPQAPAGDFPTMLALAGTKPVLLQEVGYPSDSLNGSSEQLEAQFVASALQAWRVAGRRMPYLNYFLLHDLHAATCDSLAAYYGTVSDPPFTSYLCSLGLRRADGAPKPAWAAFVAGTR